MIAKPDDSAGLSNRIKCIVNAMYQADKNNTNLSLNWNKSFVCGANYHDLFTYPIVQTKDTTGIVINTYEFPKISKKKILSYLNKLKIKKEITNEADYFFNKKLHTNAIVIGVHVRRTDFRYNSYKNKNSDELYFKRMDEMIENNPEIYFFIATDSKKTENEFIKRYGGRIIIYPKKEFDKESANGVKEAFIELLILSKCNHILGSYLSTFSELAYWYGGCKGIEYIGKPKGEVINIKDRKSSFLGNLNQFMYKNFKLYRLGLKKLGYW